MQPDVLRPSVLQNILTGEDNLFSLNSLTPFNPSQVKMQMEHGVVEGVELGQAYAVRFQPSFRSPHLLVISCLCFGFQ